MYFRTALALVLTCAAGAAQALTLLPGTTLDQNDYFTSGEVTAGDPDFLGTELVTVVASATEIRDGFDGSMVVDDLYNVTGTITATAIQSVNGHAVFAYDLSSVDMSGAGALNGAAVFSVSGYAGFDVDVGWISPTGPEVPPVEIMRSADGDTVTFTFEDPRISQSDFLETILLKTDADTFDLLGEGEVVIAIDSFGDMPRSLSGLPQPAVIPLPMSGLLLLGALGALGVGRRRA
ncbi:hypothetical protein [Dinoroseobacter sp. S76]|uniref:hypothetical protein n=1 Tax=Dinoroseobacter sp. S76 TaxID=3415124 RepID=UPI003C7BCDF5